MTEIIWNKKQKTKKIKAKKPRLFFSKLFEKYKSGEKMFIYEENKLKKYLVAKLDMMVSQIVRSRDCAGGAVKCGSYKSCKSCLGMITYSTSVCAHWIDRGRWSHRRDFRNLFACCSGCNDPAYDAVVHKTELQFKIEEIYGHETVKDMRANKSKEKPRTYELIQIYEKILPVWQQIPEDWKG